MLRNYMYMYNHCSKAKAIVVHGTELLVSQGLREHCVIVHYRARLYMYVCVLEASSIL